MNIVIKMGKKLNFIKKMKHAKEAKYLSPVRRIERVHPIDGARICAMTFDDGPCNLPPNPPVGTVLNDESSFRTVPNRVSLTEHLVNTLKKYNATGTFNIIGDTSLNYPDTEGALHSPLWGGTLYDHYPDFGKDHEGGAKHKPALVKLLIDNGHEISNHGYKHILFGRKRAIYGKRAYLPSLDAVVGDLKQLDDMVMDEHGYAMVHSRPPHYIDNIAGGYDSYHAYQKLNYQYLAASYDGGGWLATTGDYEKDVAMMVSPMEALLKEDPDALNGQIIFQKDGFNMSKQTPVATALEEHLKLLTSYGYKVVTVKELLSLSPVRDIPTTHPALADINYLLDKGHAICYRNNSFKPDQSVSIRELFVMLCPRKVLDAHIGKNIYKVAAAWALSTGLTIDINSAMVSKDDFANILKTLYLERDTGNIVPPVVYGTDNLLDGPLKRIDVIPGIKAFVETLCS